MTNVPAMRAPATTDFAMLNAAIKIKALICCFLYEMFGSTMFSEVKDVLYNVFGANHFNLFQVNSDGVTNILVKILIQPIHELGLNQGNPTVREISIPTTTESTSGRRPRNFRNLHPKGPQSCAEWK